MDVPTHDFTRSHYGSGSGTGSSPAPLTRARSAQEILASPPPKRYYYEDYADSSPSASSTSTSSRALHLAPPGPAAASSSSSHSATASPTQYNYTNTYTSGAQLSEEPTDDAANMRWSFPEPEIPNYGSPSRSSPTFGQPPPSSYSPTGRKGHGLVLPRKPSHRSTLSQERGEFALPYNNSETSFDAAGVLADYHFDHEGTDGSRTPTSIAPSVAQSANEPVMSEEERQHELLQNGIMKFQEGSLPDADNEWHRLVSVEFRESLPKNEIQRQSTIFEVMKSERDYVNDLWLVEDVFIKALMEADPPVITPNTRLRTFRNEVFQNITDIQARHRDTLSALFARQRAEHPLISSIADIELDSALSVQPDYEAYIKQYPIAEARHRRELKANPAYAKLIEKALKDPRLKKRGLIDLISRPVTRLPRISLILEHIFKLTDAEHPDIETMPLTLTILSDFVKSTQPGVQVADSKVKFWSLCESLIYRPGEIIEMDLYDPQRHLVHAGVVARRDGSGWRDVTVSLLDNYLIITSPEVRLGRTYNVLISRPIPLEVLGLGSFKDEPVSRRDDSGGSGRLLSSLTKPSRPAYPWTVFHRLDVKRRYTFYCERETLRTGWHDAIVDAMAVRNTEREVNKWYASEVIDDGTFVSRTAKVPASSKNYFTGRITGCATFVDAGKSYIAVSTGEGIYAATLVSRPQFRRVLPGQRFSSLSALSAYHKLLVLQDGALLSYNLRVLVRVILGKSPADSFAGSMERLSPKDSSVYLFTAGAMGGRNLVVYAVKGFRNTTMQALEAVSQGPTPNQNQLDPVTTFRPYGNQFYVPRDAHHVMMLQKTLAISTANGIAIVEPTQVGSDIAIVPDWSAGSKDSSLQARAMLKERCDASQPLGLVQSGENELMVVYEAFGCYITKHGAPARKHGFVRWETPIQSFVVREPHVLLVGTSSIEVRHTPTGRLLQVIEGKEIRLVQTLPKEQGPTLIACRGKVNDEKGLSDQLVELVPTTALELPSADDSGLIWEEWGV